jgi:predicted RNA-binding protein YlxR (DUF448 family)
VPERQPEKEYEDSQAQSLQARGQYTYDSKEEIAQNARKSIAEEAFRRYSQSKDDLEVLLQIFNCLVIENYYSTNTYFILGI